MKKIFISGLVAGLFGLSACHDFLQPKSQSEFVPETVQSLDEMLVGEVYMGPEDIGLYNILGVFDDDVACTPQVKYSDNQEKNIEQGRLAFSWDRNMIHLLSGYGSIYSVMYKHILGCNAVMDFIDGVDGSKEQRGSVKAQALTMRAFYYLHLVNLYGKPYSFDRNALGVPLKLTSELNTSGIPRNTVGEVYRQIVDDLLEAERQFEVAGEPEKGWKASRRATAPVTDLLLSRVYLYMEDWRNAVKYGEKVLEYKGFGLYDLNAVPDPVSNRGYYPDLCSLENPETIFQFGSQGDAAQMGSRQMEWQEELRPGILSTLSQSLFRASDELVACMNEIPGDLRKNVYLMWDAPSIEDLEYYRPLSKYPAFYYRMDISYTQWGAVLKITEAYLNAAEAAAMVYKTEGDGAYRTKALGLLNTLRQQRFASYVPLTEADFTSADELVEFTRRERRRELCFEHHRWFDLRRYGMEPLTHTWNPREGRPITYTLEKNDAGFTLLIPQGAFSLNPALVQNETRGN